MAVPLTSAHVEDEILRLCAVYETTTEEFAVASRRAAETEATHKSRRARAFLQAEGTDKKREAIAEMQCEVQFRDRRIAEALQLSLRAKCEMLRTEIEALRTVAANIRAQT